MIRCPNCSAENTDGARFCENCGQALERACPSCGRPVSAGARFCRNCGFDLSAPAAEAHPPASRPAAGAPAATSERKLITALFADIVGSTSLAERMDPEDWREIVAGVHARVTEIVTRYEGTIAQLLGDGVLAFFGAPITHEDDAERATRAALDILAAIPGNTPHAPSSADLQMRIGLNSGLVVVGNLGSGAHVEYLAVGDTINLAARLQSAAEPGDALMSENTHRLVESLFQLEDGGEITLKGKAEPVRIYRVLAERKGAARRRGIAGLTSPMVGREREASALLSMIDALSSGRGGIVAIVGEAGLGKSRLVAEVRRERATQGITWITGRCLSYTSALPYHLAIDILRGLIGVAADATAEDTQRALRRSVDEALTTDADEVYPFLGHLLDLELDEQSAARVSYLQGPALQARYVAAYRRFVEAVTRDKPAVIICEDIHWADASSVDLLVQVLPVAAQAPLLFILLSRPDRGAAGWKLISQELDIAGAGASELHLAPLSETDSRQLVANLLSVESLPTALRQMILAKAEGNPFFVEEVIRMLIEQDALQHEDGRWLVTRDVQSIEIPSTVQGVLAGRLDRLPEDSKRVLQMASVIGRRFEASVLDAVLGGRPALATALPQLVDAQLLRRLPEAEPAYAFRHALTCDAAYQSMLQKQRRAEHLRVAQVYEERAAGHVDDYAGLLARHYAAAGEDGKTLAFSLLAGDAAARVYANAEAVGYYDLALDAIRRQGGSTDQLVHAFLARGRVLEISSQMQRALESYQEMLALGRTRGDDRVQLAALIAVATIQALKVSGLADVAQAEALAREAQALADRLGDRRAEAKTLWILQLIRRDGADTTESIAFGEQALAIARELQWDEQVALILNDLSTCYVATGQVEHAHAALAEANKLWRKLNNLPMLAETLANEALFAFVLDGREKDALSMLDESRRINVAIDNRYGLGYSYSLTGMIQREVGEYADALQNQKRNDGLSRQLDTLISRIITPTEIAILYGAMGQIERAIAIVQEGITPARTSLPSTLAWPLIALARLLISKGDLQAAAAAIRESYASLEKGSWVVTLPLDTLIVDAEWHLAQGDFARAVALVDSAQAMAKRVTSGFHLGNALLVKAQALIALGQSGAAREALQEGQRAAEHMNARPVLWRILAMLARLAEESGDTAQADALRRQARTLVAYIVDHIGAADLQASFLALREVRDLMGYDSPPSKLGGRQ